MRAEAQFYFLLVAGRAGTQSLEARSQVNHLHRRDVVIWLRCCGGSRLRTRALEADALGQLELAASRLRAPRQSASRHVRERKAIRIGAQRDVHMHKRR